MLYFFFFLRWNILKVIAQTQGDFEKKLNHTEMCSGLIHSDWYVPVSNIILLIFFAHLEFMLWLNIFKDMEWTMFLHIDMEHTQLSLFSTIYPWDLLKYYQTSDLCNNV